jgi:hypothetical protein
MQTGKSFIYPGENSSGTIYYPGAFCARKLPMQISFFTAAT